MNSSSVRPLVAFRQELPWRDLAPLAHHLAGTERGVVFLDAGGDPAEDGRWSVLGWRPRRTMVWPAGRPGAVEGLRRFLAAPSLLPDPNCPVPFRGGFLGWIGYDIGRDVERLPSRLPVDPRVPEWAFAEYEFLLVADRRDRRLFATGTCDPQEGPSRLLARQSEALDRFDAAEAAWNSLPAPDDPALPAAAADVRPEIDRDTYLARAEAVLRYIRAGDVFQANLAQRFAGTLAVPVPELYRRLRAASPAPYGGIWRVDGAPDVLSVSPELFLRRTGDRVVTKPIKGTRPRGPDPVADAALRADLRDAEKDRAELAMIVDLLRNDLGRVARTGTVRVDEPRALVAHPTVHHAVATVSCETDRSVHAADLVRATMPGGSITGAPKIRAMEILEELEDVRRGPYCGAAGWIGRDGDVALNILIRTLVVTPPRGGAEPSESRVTFHVGGGIVADSQPVPEYEETLVKARALLRALRGGGARGVGT